MKKTYKLLLVALLFSLSSCHYMLDVTPENAVTFTNYFEDEKDLEAITYDMHYYLKRNPYFYTEHWKMGEFMDETTNYYQAFRDLNPASIRGSINLDWDSDYKIIYLANVILDESHRVKKITQDRLDFHLGQAHFAKGYVYFHLSRIYGDAIITKDSRTVTAYATRPVIEVINEAIRCAKLAYDLLPNYEDAKDISGNRLDTKQFGNRGSVAALLAQAYAWKGSVIDNYKLEGESSKTAYEESVYWSTQLIEKKAGNTYDLEGNIESLCLNSLMKTGSLSMESVLEHETDKTVPNPANYTPFYMYLSYPVDKTKSAGMIQSRTFRIKNSTVQAMYTGKDERRTGFFNQITQDTTTAAINGGYAYPWKWRSGIYKNNALGGLVWAYLDGNYIYWRLADFYLLRAECNNKLGNIDLAITDLNRIRSRAKADLYPANSDTQDLKYAIFKEREKELLFEGHRYYDVVRNGYWKTEFSGAFKTLTDQDVKDGALCLPIGTKAFVNNEIIRQNRYWSQFE